VELAGLFAFPCISILDKAYPLFSYSNDFFPTSNIFLSFSSYTHTHTHTHTHAPPSLQAQSLCRFQSFPDKWSTHPQFFLGLALFVMGMGINLHSDATLRHLSKAKQQKREHQRQQKQQSSYSSNNNTGYQIPHGGFFEYVSAPHYFGEIVEWLGFAVMNQCSLASVAFVTFTAANLIPRGVAHHAWYRRTFADDYPKYRRAVIPFVW